VENILTGLFLKILVLLSLGFFLYKKKYISSTSKGDLSNLLINIIIPINIVVAGNIKYSVSYQKNLLMIGILAVIYFFCTYIFGYFFLFRVACRKKFKDAIVVMCMFGNVGFIGFPLLQELYGQEGYLYCVIFNLFYQLIFFTLGIKMFGSNEKIDFLFLVKNPVTVSSIFSILLFISGFRIPVQINDALFLVGNMTTPIALLLIGCSLATISLSSIWNNKWSFIISFMRLIFIPMFALVIMMFVNCSSIIKECFVILLCLPVGSLNVIYAERYDFYTEFVSGTMVQSTFLMIFSVPTVIYIVNLIF
jgi:predicted permease